MTTTMTFHAALAKALVDNGARTMFGLIGDANLYMADSYVRLHGGQFIAAAHEVGAALMALGYAARTGGVGVATVTHGPGLTNTMTALVEGVKASLSMVLVCGDTAIEDRDSLQNVAQRELVLATGAGFEQLRSPRTLAEDVATAFRRATMERRPIALNIPADFMWLEVEYTALPQRILAAPPGLSGGPELEEAAAIIAAARRPIVLAGRGAVVRNARDSLLRLIARTEALAATTLKAKSFFAGEACDIGIFGTLSTPEASAAIADSDCIIAFGASLNRFTTFHGTLLRGKRLVQVSFDPAEIGRFGVRANVALVGDPGAVADALVRLLDEAEIPPSGFSREWTGSAPIMDEPGRVGAEGVDLPLALRQLNRMVPAGRIVFTDAGRFIGPTWKTIDVERPELFHLTNNFGSIGLGLSEAIGACIADPDRPVLLVTGDGGFMLGGLTEFNTAVRHGCDLIVVVCNDSSYGAEHIQYRRKEMDPSLSLFAWPDFGPVAEALGGKGVTVRNHGDMGAVARAIATRDRPLLIDIKLDPDHVPQLQL
jgi:thiamine pyrophosphate-dependent acetolactate synthase large subunit-like protein